MKSTIIALVAGLSSMVASKNVYNLHALDDVDQASNDKRDAKNVPNLEFLKELSENGKRDAEPKNVINLQDLKVGVDDEDEGKEKRDAKNTPNLIDCYNNLLQSILPQLKSVSIFAGYIRDNKDLNSKTEALDSNMLIISPTDDAIENKLSNLKPWEFPTLLDEATTEQDQDKILQDNLQNYLDGHIVVAFQDKINIEDGDQGKEKVVVTKLNNGELLEIKQNMVSQTFSVRVAAKHKKWIPVVTVRQVENGFIFVIDDSLVKP